MMKRLAMIGALLGLLVVAESNAVGREENSPRVGLGNGHYRNPVLSGDYGDPSVVRVGADYYLTHSGGGEGLPNLLVWHSRDLVNWRPIGKALNAPLGTPWAPDLVHHQGRFYLYVTLVDQARGEGRAFMNLVLTATNAAGPWSAPVDLKLNGFIDPGHVVDAEGRRWLFLDKGNVVRLAADGLSTVGEVKRVYDGWPIPAEWVVECFCLESPKLFWRDGWLYLVSAQGGTSGPSTSHMIVVARAKSPLGPWENTPNNPLLRTVSPAQRWWSQGHGTLVDDIAGNWWVMFHAYENGFRALGRQTLLLPVRWNAEGWPEIIAGADSDGVFPMPAGESLRHSQNPSDDFSSATLGWQWYRSARLTPDFFTTDGGALHLRGQGSRLSDAAMLYCKPLDHAYESQVYVTATNGTAGLWLGAGDTGLGMFVADGKVNVRWRGRAHPLADAPGGQAWLKVRNVRHDVSAFYSLDGQRWVKCDRGTELSSVRVRIGLFATEGATAEFRSFEYRQLD